MYRAGIASPAGKELSPLNIAHNAAGRDFVLQLNDRVPRCALKISIFLCAG
jgi:hypothetical protein